MTCFVPGGQGERWRIRRVSDGRRQQGNDFTAEEVKLDLNVAPMNGKADPLGGSVVPKTAPFIAVV